MAIMHLANACIDIYIDADSVARDDHKWLRPRVHVAVRQARLVISNSSLKMSKKATPNTIRVFGADNQASMRSEIDVMGRCTN
jgi:hypothetical protein